MILLKILLIPIFLIFLGFFTLGMIVRFAHIAFYLLMISTGLAVSLLFGLFFSSLIAGVVLCVILFALWSVTIYKFRRRKHRKNSKNPTAKIHIRDNDENVGFDIFFPLFVIKILKICPKRLLSKISAKSDRGIDGQNIKNFIDLVCKEAAGTTIELKDKNSEIFISIG